MAWKRWLELCLFIGGLVSGMPAAFAGRPLSTDDASVIPKGGCQVESWYQTADGARELHVAPGCGVADDLEIDLEGVRFSPVDGDRHAIGAQVKAVFPALDAAGWKFGGKVNAAVAQSVPAERWETDAYSATGIATRELADGLALHLNLGVERRRRESQNAATYGAALAWDASPHVLVFAEMLGDDKSGATRIVGGRWWLVPEKVGLDLTLGNQAGVADSHFVTVGISFYGLGL